MKNLKILNLLFVFLILGGIGLAQETEEAEIDETMEAFDEPIIISNEEDIILDENELEEELNETLNETDLSEQELDETELDYPEEFEEDYDEEYAEEIPDVPEEDLEEAKTFAYPLGAELRMLQLEKAIERNIASGELIIEEIKDENLTTETDDLESILDELRSLLEEVKSYDFNQGKSSEEMALDFVEFKAEARELTTLFRETATNITGNMHLEIRERVNKRMREFKESQQREINELKNRYNQRVMEEIAVQAGLTDDEVTEKIRQGNINVDEYKETLKEEITEKGNNIEKHAALNNMINMNVQATLTKEMTREQGSEALRNVERIRKNVEERAHKEEISGSQEEVDDLLKQDDMNSNDKRNNSGDEE